MRRITRGTFHHNKSIISNAGYEKAKASIEESLKKFKTDYIDLLLIHQPFGDYYGSYRAMEEIGGTHGKTVAQTALRLLTQRGVCICNFLDAGIILFCNRKLL